MGEEAYSVLLLAAQDSPVELPSHITVQLLDGQVVHLGPHLTTPSPAHLTKTPNLLLSNHPDGCVVSHKQEERRSSEWEEQLLQEEEEEDDEDGVECGEEGDPGDKMKGEDDDDPPDPDEPVVNLQQLEKRHKVFVSYENKQVSKEDLEEHFAMYGKVRDVFITLPFNNFAAITFDSDATAEFILSSSGRPGEEGERLHSLQLPGAQGGSVPLRLRGGSGRGCRVPPTQQRNAVSSFR